jgi:hypothetical protein
VLCLRRLERILAIDTETAELERQIADLVAATGTTLTDLHGIGPLIAARFLPRPSMSDATRAATPLPPRTAPLHCPPPQTRPSDTGTTPAGTGNRTGRSTPSRTPKSAATPKAAPTTNAKAAAGKTRREALRCPQKGGYPTIVFTTMRHDVPKSLSPASDRWPGRPHSGWVRPTQTRHD